MSRLAGALLLLVPLAAGAESKLFDPPQKDESPSAFACTADTLASGEQCTFEGKAGPSASGAVNRQRLEAMAPQACEKVVSEAGEADAPALRDGCMARLKAAAGRCSHEGALVDAQGRFTDAGKTCYRALSDARSQAVSLANAAPTCCACLSEHHCSGAGESCVQQAARATLKLTCDGDACDAACAELATSAGPVSSKSPSSGRGKRAK